MSRAHRDTLIDRDRRALDQNVRALEENLDENLELTAEGDALQRELAEVALRIVDILNRLKPVWDSFRASRLQTMAKIRECYSTIDYHHRNGEIATTTGAVFGITGGLLTLGALAAAPFTGGVSLLALAAGAGLSATGALTEFGADTLSTKFIADEMEEARPILEYDRSVFEIFNAVFGELAAYEQECAERLEDSPTMTASEKFQYAFEIAKQAYNLVVGLGFQGIINARRAVNMVSTLEIAAVFPRAGALTAQMEIQARYIRNASTLRRVTGLGFDMSEAAAATASRWAFRAAGALAIVGVAIEVNTLVHSITDLVHGTLDEMSVELRRILGQLDAQFQSILTYCSSLGLVDPTYIIWNRSANKVLDLTANNFDSRTKIQLWSMNGTMAQVWRLHQGGIQHVGSGKMIDIRGGSRDPSATIQISDAHNGWNQKWGFAADGTIVNPDTDNCLDIRGGRSADGTEIISYPFHGGTNQQWSLVQRVYIQNIRSGKVLDCRDGGTANGTNIWQYSINGTPAQIWGIMGDGTIMHCATGKCLEIAGGRTSNGANVQLYQRNGSEAQNWVVRPDGTIVNPKSGKGLDIDGGSLEDRANVRIWRLNGTNAQRFRVIHI